MTKDEAIAQEIADKLLGRIPQNALGWAGRVGSVDSERAKQLLCRAVSLEKGNQKGWLCVRPKGHSGDHVATNSNDEEPLRWRNKQDDG